jgi:hypothetical protein
MGRGQMSSRRAWDLYRAVRLSSCGLYIFRHGEQLAKAANHTLGVDGYHNLYQHMPTTQHPVPMLDTSSRTYVFIYISTWSNHNNVAHHKPLALDMVSPPQSNAPRLLQQLNCGMSTSNHHHRYLMMAQQPSGSSLLAI